MEKIKGAGGGGLDSHLHGPSVLVGYIISFPYVPFPYIKRTMSLPKLFSKAVVPT